MSEQTYRERWIGEVFSTPLVTDSVRVALLAMAREMDEHGRVSMKLKALAARLGRSDRKTADRIKAAVTAGYLERVGRGQKYRTAAYQATLPARVSRTPGGPADDSQGDGFQHPENRPQQDPRGSSERDSVDAFSRTPGGPAEAPAYRGTARAHSRSTHSNHRTPPESGTDTTTPDETKTRVSQSSRKREAFRYLNERYGLTEFESAAVVAEVTARAPQEIRSLVRYMDAMKEGDLADIVAAVQCRTDNGPHEAAPENARSLAAVPEWCGSCEQTTRLLSLLDGRVKRCPACHPLRNQETA